MKVDCKILFQDDDLIAFTKPPGIAIHATLDRSRPNFYDTVRGVLPVEVAKGLSLHHRLDVHTSGVVLFSKSERMNHPLQLLFQNRGIRKTYLAVTHALDGGKLEDRFVMKNHLRMKGRPAIAVAVTSGGKVAETAFEVLVRGDRFWTIQAEPKTGRTHQIRAHLSQLGLPLISDSLYGGRPTLGVKAFLLHAQSLEFLHPFSQKKIFIESPVPESFRPFLPRSELGAGRALKGRG